MGTKWVLNQPVDHGVLRGGSCLTVAVVVRRSLRIVGVVSLRVGAR